ncbi:hypothetical protein ASN88_00502 [Streptococcus parauberis]|uniref:hypothetical protein n=1 Tax=Streptococcus parauberis TaxID=1348 RepID=UPI000CCEAEFF|nr:hypothetical protein [Streptococcus parauberis]PNY22392.1 hypothetical protein ASN88_00502 [Streptococcus parauberis]
MYNEGIATMILAFGKGDCRPESFDWDDFEVTASQLIASGQSNGELKFDYLGPYLDL